jgi:adenylosuccinate lyase
MRSVWLALAEAQHEFGLVSDEQLSDLRSTANEVDIERATQIEAETSHDVMAEVKTWAEQAPVGGAVLHLGATSADITDNVDALRLRDGLALIEQRLADATAAVADRVETTADIVTMGWTHLQPAAPTTVGYRLASTLADLLADLDELRALRTRIRGKGFKGAVGTRASFVALLGSAEAAAAMDTAAMARLGLEGVQIATQVYPRKLDWQVLSVLAGIAASASRFAYNIRLLQSPPFGEWSEGFAAGQVGSTAMPWKRNPINAENVDSLARYVAALPTVAWQNEAALLLERTLDDSGNRRIVLPEAFLATDEILMRTKRLADRLDVDERAIALNLERFGPFAAIERVLMATAASGADRQAMHERLRLHSLAAWEAIARGKANPLVELVADDEELAAFVEPDVVARLLASPEKHVGDAPDRARWAVASARESIRR